VAVSVNLWFACIYYVVVMELLGVSECVCAYANGDCCAL
jgi:hypothetical protein